jgi:hypothetical protein
MEMKGFFKKYYRYINYNSTVQCKKIRLLEHPMGLLLDNLNVQ